MIFFMRDLFEALSGLDRCIVEMCSANEESLDNSKWWKGHLEFLQNLVLRRLLQTF